MSTISEVIERKMNALEYLMKNQMHLEMPSVLSTLFEDLSKYVGSMSDQDKDYLDCAFDAMKSKRKWIA